MNVRLDPLVSEFVTDEQSASYDAWFREKAREAINGSEPPIAHEEAMARVNSKLNETKAARGGPAVA